MLQVFASSIALSLACLCLLAWKWHIKMKMAIAAAIVIGGLTGLIVNVTYSRIATFGWAMVLLVEFCLILLMTLIGILTRFYRDPERRPLETERVILSPADGKVIYVHTIEEGSALVSTKGDRKFRLDEIAETDLLADAAYLVGIDMNILNVHVNRSPIRGKAILLKRTKGKFVSLRRQDSEIVNERVTTIIANGTTRVGVVQIASRLVRRIVSSIKEGENLEMGQRIGAIVFGSQVDVVIPKLENLKIEVKPGNEVKAGISVIARYG
jgi:phosphatidylserine decarboxylase